MPPIGASRDPGRGVPGCRASAREELEQVCVEDAGRLQRPTEARPRDADDDRLEREARDGRVPDLRAAEIHSIRRRSACRRPRAGRRASRRSPVRPGRPAARRGRTSPRTTQAPLGARDRREAGSGEVRSVGGVHRRAGEEDQSRPASVRRGSGGKDELARELHAAGAGDRDVLRRRPARARSRGSSGAEERRDARRRWPRAPWSQRIAHLG